MKLSEVVKAIENGTFENDMDEKDHEVMIYKYPPSQK